MKRMMIALLMLLAACGGESDEDSSSLPSDDEVGAQGDDEWVGTRAQDVTFIPAFGFRNDLGTSNTRCVPNTTVTSHTCNYPPDKTITVKVDTAGMNTTELSAATGYTDGWIAIVEEDLPSYTFSRVESGTTDLTISKGSLPGDNKNSIHTYAKASVSNPSVALDDFGATGVYQKYGQIFCTIDFGKINSHFSNSEKPRVRSHTVHYCNYKAVGLGSGGGGARTHRITTITSSFGGGISPMAACMAETWDPTSNPNQILPVCGGDFGPCPCAGLSDS